MKNSTWKLHGFAWITGGFFLLSLVGHWVLGWFAFVNEQASHNQPVHMSEYVIQVGRDTLENWQSEFLQLIWQVCGLAFLLYVGSPQSKEGDDRKEAKLDAILKRLAPEDADRMIAAMDRQFPRR